MDILMAVYNEIGDIFAFVYYRMGENNRIFDMDRMFDGHVISHDHIFKAVWIRY